MKPRHTGIGAHRLPREPREKIAAEIWEAVAENTLPYLLSRTNDRAHVEDREYQIAATVVQWLGSPVGQNFIEQLQAKWKAIA